MSNGSAFLAESGSVSGSSNSGTMGSHAFGMSGSSSSDSFLCGEDSGESGAMGSESHSS